MSVGRRSERKSDSPCARLRLFIAKIILFRSPPRFKCVDRRAAGERRPCRREQRPQQRVVGRRRRRRWGPRDGWRNENENSESDLKTKRPRGDLRHAAFSNPVLTRPRKPDVIETLAKVFKFVADGVNTRVSRSNLS